MSAHFAEIYGASVGKDQVSRITDAVIGELTEWQHRPLDRCYPVVFIDAIMDPGSVGRSASPVW